MPPSHIKPKRGGRSRRATRDSAGEGPSEGPGEGEESRPGLSDESQPGDPVTAVETAAGTSPDDGDFESGGATAVVDDPGVLDDLDAKVAEPAVLPDDGELEGRDDDDAAVDEPPTSATSAVLEDDDEIEELDDSMLQDASVGDSTEVSTEASIDADLEADLDVEPDMDVELDDDGAPGSAVVRQVSSRPSGPMSAPPPMPPGATSIPPRMRAASVDEGRSRPASIPPPFLHGEPDAAVDAEPDPLLAPLETPTALDRLVATPESAELRADALTLAIDAASAAGDSERVAALSYELGELSERALGDEPRATRAYGRALQSDPALAANLWAIRRLFYRRALWPNLVKLIAAEARIADSDLGRAELHVERGQVLEAGIGDDAEAHAAYLEAVQADPTYQPALLGVERIALRRGDLGALETTWSQLADAVEAPGRRLGYLLDLAALHAGRGEFHAADAAMERGNELALGVEDRDTLLIERERLAERSGELSLLAAALDARIRFAIDRFGPAGPPAAADGDPRSDQTKTESAGSDDASARVAREVVALCRRAAQLWATRLGDPARAWGYLQQAIALSPRDPLLVADLADLAERLGKYGELADLVAGWAEGEVDPARALGLSLRRADALFHAGQVDAARAVLATLSASSPGYLPILAMRERDALARGDRLELARVATELAEAVERGVAFGPGQHATPDPVAAAELELVAGDLFARAGELGIAGDRYRRALAQNPEMTAALLALADLEERAGRPAAAAALLARHSETASPEARRHALEHLADLRRQAGDAAALLAVLEQLWAIDPGDRRIAWRIDECLIALGDGRRRIEHLIAVAADLTDPDHRAATVLEAARLADRELGDLDRAIELYRQVVDAWPSDRFARVALIDALGRAGRLAEVVSERRAEAQISSDGNRVARALREAGDLLLERLGRPDEAAEVFAELLDRSPDDLAVMRGRSLARLAAGQIDLALESFDAEVDAQRDGAGQLAALQRLGRTAERLGRREIAEDAYRRALLVEPGSVHASVGLLELGAESGDRVAELFALEQLIEGRDGALAAELAERAGWLAALALGDVDRAGELFARAAAVSDGAARPGALLGVALVEAKRGDRLMLGEALGRLGRTLAGSYAAASLLMRAAVLAESEGDDRAAAERLDRALAAAPADPALLVAVVEHEAGLLPSPASDSEDGLMRRAARLAARAELATDDDVRGDLALEQAELLEAAGRLAEAGAAIAPVLQRRPDDLRALGLVRRLCRRAGDERGVAAAAMALARTLGDPVGKLELLREAARIFDRPDGDLEQAVASYRRVLAEEPGAPEFDRLNQLLVTAADVGGRFELVSARLAYLASQGDAGGEAALLVERAELRLELGDRQGADRDLGAALERQPGSAAALFRRAELSVGQGDVRRTAWLYQQYLEVAEDPVRRSAAELALSRLLAENMDDIDGAIVQLEHVIRQVPDDAALRERLVALLLRADQPARAIEELRHLTRLRSDDTARARDAVQIATIAQDRLGDRAQARLALDEAQRLDPLGVDAALALGDGEADRAVVAGNVIAGLRQAIAEPAADPALYLRLARVAAVAGRPELEHAALAAAAASTELEPTERERMAALAGPDVEPFAGVLGESDWARLVPAAAHGVIADLWNAIAPAVASGQPTAPARLGFGKSDRMKEKDLERGFPRVGRLARAFGLGEIEVWIAEGKPGFARVVAAEVPVVYLGADVARAADAGTRFALGRALAQVRSGGGVLADVQGDALVPLFAGAMAIAGGREPTALAALGPVDATRRAESERSLGKQLGRRSKKALALLTSRLAEMSSPVAFKAALAAADARAGLLAARDLAAALDRVDGGAGSALGRELIAWSVSVDRLELDVRLWGGER